MSMPAKNQIQIRPLSTLTQKSTSSEKGCLFLQMGVWSVLHIWGGVPAPQYLGIYVFFSKEAMGLPPTCHGLRGDGCLEIMMNHDPLPRARACVCACACAQTAETASARARARRPRRPRVRVLVLDRERVATV